MTPPPPTSTPSPSTGKRPPPKEKMPPPEQQPATSRATLPHRSPIAPVPGPLFARPTPASPARSSPVSLHRLFFTDLLSPTSLSESAGSGASIHLPDLFLRVNQHIVLRIMHRMFDTPPKKSYPKQTNKKPPKTLHRAHPPPIIKKGQPPKQALKAPRLPSPLPLPLPRRSRTAPPPQDFCACYSNFSVNFKKPDTQT